MDWWGGALLQAALAPGKPDQERENLVTRHGSPNGVHAAAFQMTRNDTELDVCTRAPWDRPAPLPHPRAHGGCREREFPPVCAVQGQMSQATRHGADTHPTA